MPSRNAALTAATLARASRTLARRDPVLRTLYRAHGPPPLWDRRPGFRTLVRIVLEQQVSLASARSTLRRVERAFGPVSAASLLRAGEAGLRSAGVTRQKARYCVHLGQASVSGELNLARVARAGDREAAAELTSFTGVGRWTAEVYLLMALRRPDVWPAADLALAKAVQAVKGLEARPSEDEMRAVAEPWRPFRAVAARMLWQDYLSRGR